MPKNEWGRIVGAGPCSFFIFFTTFSFFSVSSSLLHLEKLIFHCVWWKRDGPTDGRTNRRTYKASYRYARSHLKMDSEKYGRLFVIVQSGVPQLVGVWIFLPASPGHRSPDVSLSIGIQRNPAIAHFKGLVDFMPYCERCLIANI